MTLIAEVDETLASIATDEYRAIAREALDVFASFEYDDHEQEFMNIVSPASWEDTASVLPSIDILLREHLDKIMGLHNIELSDDTDIATRVSIARGILSMQYWEDPDTLLALCSQDASAEEIFADLINEVEGLRTTEVLDAVTSFDEAYNKRLVQVLTGQIPEEDPFDEPVDPEQLKRLRALKAFLNNDLLIGFRLIKLGYRIGAPLQAYISKVQNRIQDMPAEQLAFEMMVLLFMARDTWSKPLLAWRESNASLFLDLNVVTEADVKIAELLGQLDRFNTQSPIAV